MKTSLIKLACLIISLAIIVHSQSNCHHYDTRPFPMPPDVKGFGYQANSLFQAGNEITFEPETWTKIAQVSVIMSAQAPHSKWPEYRFAAGYDQLITLSIFDTNQTLLYSNTHIVIVPWRPEPSPNCSADRWMDVYGHCWPGLAFEVSFSTTDCPVLPPTIIYAIEFNTQTAGFHPLGTPGPYNYLSLGMTMAYPTVGTNSLGPSLFLNSSSSSAYGDGGPVNIFRPVISPYFPIVDFLDYDC